MQQPSFLESSSFSSVTCGRQAKMKKIKNKKNKMKFLVFKRKRIPVDGRKRAKNASCGQRKFLIQEQKLVYFQSKTGP